MAYLDQESINFFNENGYLVIENLVDEETVLQPLEAEYEALLNRVAHKLKAEGKLEQTYDDLPFGQRLTQMLLTCQDSVFRYLDISLPAKATYDTPLHCGPAVFDLLKDPNLLDAVESIIGPEIYSHPLQHVRIKPPETMVPETIGSDLVRRTMWHQDLGFVTEDADQSDMLTVWVAITDANEENGCLTVIPGSHLEGLALHCPQQVVNTQSQSLQIPDRYMRLPEAIAVPVKRGGALFLNRLTQHASLANHSDDIRWSFDLRFLPVGQSTGRTFYPGFVARSSSDQDSELNDCAQWAYSWKKVKQTLYEQQAPKAHRWESDLAACE